MTTLNSLRKKTRRKSLQLTESQRADWRPGRAVYNPSPHSACSDFFSGIVTEGSQTSFNLKQLLSSYKESFITLYLL